MWNTCNHRQDHQMHYCEWWLRIGAVGSYSNTARTKTVVSFAGWHLPPAARWPHFKINWSRRGSEAALSNAHHCSLFVCPLLFHWWCSMSSLTSLNCLIWWAVNHSVMTLISRRSTSRWVDARWQSSFKQKTQSMVIEAKDFFSSLTFTFSVGNLRTPAKYRGKKKQ